MIDSWQHPKRKHGVCDEVGDDDRETKVALGAAMSAILQGRVASERRPKEGE